MRVAALYVDTARGPYPRIPGVECFGFASKTGHQSDLFARTRDATSYNGPWPIVAHPPCGPWGRFWWNYGGGEGAKHCGPRAVEQVRQWGGVIEHPKDSNLWRHCELPRPEDGRDSFGGRTILVHQCDWGHPAQKATWLYVVGAAEIPPFPPTRAPTHVMVRLRRNNNELPELSKRRRHITPPDFALWLVALAASAGDPDRRQ